jgi:sugar O-acyltransferase (sialic acid O-acetyltransferase NeuD family)
MKYININFSEEKSFFIGSLTKRIVVLGNSGFAKEVMDVILSFPVNQAELYFLEKSEEHEMLEDDIVFLGMGSPSIRSDCFNFYQKFINFPKLKHPSVNLGRNIQIGDGTFLQAGVSITSNVIIGKGCVINNNVTIGHDVRLGDFSVVNPGATISGNVLIGESTLIGANSTILENIKIGSRTRIGAGAVVTKDVKEGETVVGVPARPM